MSNRPRSTIVTTSVLVVVTCALAQQASPPPLPLAGEFRQGDSEPALPEAHSPCTFDLDANWISSLKFRHRETATINVPQPINCDGAVIKSILATGSGSVTTLQFTITFRAGADREGVVTFGILDGVHPTPVALGEARDNLDEGRESFLRGVLKITNREFDRVFAPDRKPVLRVTLRVSES